MSRVHDALRRSEGTSPDLPASVEASAPAAVPMPITPNGVPTVVLPEWEEVLSKVQEVPFTPDTDAHLVDPNNPQAAPGEEFRTLRTRLNHLQTLSPIRTLVVTSASPAEGKSFAAINLAIAQAQLDGVRTILCDFDFRRPAVHSRLRLSREPGITDYLQGRAELHECIYKIKGMNLWVMPAGQSVINPLELLNLRECRNLIELLPKYFQWAILDTPPILYAADASLLSTITHGSVLVVRLGHTTIDTVTRAMQSLCTNNVIGTIVNGARQGELYSKYRYYRYYYEPRADGSAGPGGAPDLTPSFIALPGVAQPPIDPK